MNAILPSRIGGLFPGSGDERLARFKQPPGPPQLAVNYETGLREAGSWRRTIHRSCGYLIENSSVSAAEPDPSGFETQYQVVLPYLGLFEYHVGGRSAQVDTANTLFVHPDREFQDAHPVEGVGHAGIVINLLPAAVEELLFTANSRSAFSDMVRPASKRLNLITHHMLRTFEALDEPLFADEWTVAALAEAFGARAKGAARSSGVMDKAKLLLHSREGERLSLEEIARNVGVSGIYLTQEFTRVEGVPLYRYQLQLRMNRALLELPHCDSITRLALDLGFSSHSHFTSAFRRHFGITPSDYRRGRNIPKPALDRHSRGPAASGLRWAS